MTKYEDTRGGFHEILLNMNVLHILHVMIPCFLYMGYTHRLIAKCLPVLQAVWYSYLGTSQTRITVHRYFKQYGSSI